MNSELATYIRNCVSLTDKELEEIIRFFDLVKIPKKTRLLQAGEICKFEAFIIKGCIKTYFINQEGHEVILTFATENWWISDLASFHDQKPSKMYIETLEECELLQISPQKKLELLEQFPVLEKMFRLMVQRHLSASQERLFSTIAKTAEERYDDFLKRFPALPMRIPQHLIAAYLGISPEFLSRLRKRKFQK